MLILKINYINSFVFEWDLLQVLLGKPASVAVIGNGLFYRLWPVLDRPNPGK